MPENPLKTNTNLLSIFLSISTFIGSKLGLEATEDSILLTLADCDELIIF